MPAEATLWSVYAKPGSEHTTGNESSPELMGYVYAHSAAEACAKVAEREDVDPKNLEAGS